MAESFIRVGAELINLRFVRRIKTVSYDKSQDNRLIYMDDGTSFKGYIDDETYYRLSCTVVPAGPNDRAVILFYDDEEKAVQAAEVKIVAWKIGEGIGEVGRPILADDACSNGTVLVCMPDGKMLEQDSVSYDNLEEAKEAVLARQMQFAEDAKERASVVAEPT